MNGYPPLANNIQSPTQHGNIPNHIDYTTQSNYQENIHIGNPLPEEKPEHNHTTHQQIYQTAKNTFDHINSTLQAAQFLPQPHSNQEAPSHNLDTLHHTTHQQLYQTAMNTFNHTKLNFASSPIPSTTSFKPGGTITMSQPGYITSYYSSRTIPNGNEHIRSHQTQLHKQPNSFHHLVQTRRHHHNVTAWVHHIIQLINDYTKQQ